MNLLFEEQYIFLNKQISSHDLLGEESLPHCNCKQPFSIKKIFIHTDILCRGPYFHVRGPRFPYSYRGISENGLQFLSISTSMSQRIRHSRASGIPRKMCETQHRGTYPVLAISGCLKLKCNLSCRDTVSAICIK